jgi:hypothetical protein
MYLQHSDYKLEIEEVFGNENSFDPSAGVSVSRKFQVRQTMQDGVPFEPIPYALANLTFYDYIMRFEPFYVDLPFKQIRFVEDKDKLGEVFDAEVIYALDYQKNTDDDEQEFTLPTFSMMGGKKKQLWPANVHNAISRHVKADEDALKEIQEDYKEEYEQAQKDYVAAKEQAQKDYKKAKTQAQNAYEAVKKMAQNAYEAAFNAAQNAYEAALNAAQNAYEAAQNAAPEDYEEAQNAYEAAKKSATNIYVSALNAATNAYEVTLNAAPMNATEEALQRILEDYVAAKEQAQKDYKADLQKAYEDYEEALSEAKEDYEEAKKAYENMIKDAQENATEKAIKYKMLGWDGKQFNGTEIETGDLKFMVPAWYPASAMTLAFMTWLNQFVGTVNNESFYGLQPGECKYLGPEQSWTTRTVQTDDKDHPVRTIRVIELQHQFQVQLEQKDLPVGDIIVPVIPGWAYVDVHYEETLVDIGDGKKVPMKAPKQVDIVKVYNEKNFWDLFDEEIVENLTEALL